MRKQLRLGLIAFMAIGALLATYGVFAADHAEAPGASADPAADIADYYAWHKGSGDDQSFVFVLTHTGFTGATAAPAGNYDRDVLYGVHLDTDLDNEPDHSVWVRFGPSTEDDGPWGMQVSGIPGASDPLMGAVETMIEGADGSKAWAGAADDPFFFDLAGFSDTLAEGSLLFTGADAVAGLNVTAIVVEFPTGDLPVQFNSWAETRRISE